MLTYLLKRILSAIPVMGVVAIVVFSLLYFAPGDPAALLIGDTATEAEIAVLRRSSGSTSPSSRASQAGCGPCSMATSARPFSRERRCWLSSSSACSRRSI